MSTETKPATTEPVVAEVKEPINAIEESKPDATPPVEPAKKPEEAKPEEKAQEPSKVVPEKYDLKLPEDSLIDAATMERFSQVAKQRGLSNEEAQAFITEENTKLQSYVEERKNTWAQAVQADKEIGGDNLGKNVELSKRVLERFGSPELIKELNKSGYGNHPELVRLLTRIGKASSEDMLVMPGAQGSKPKTAQEILYGTNE